MRLSFLAVLRIVRGEIIQTLSSGHLDPTLDQLLGVCLRDPLFSGVKSSSGDFNERLGLRLADLINGRETGHQLQSNGTLYSPTAAGLPAMMGKSCVCTVQYSSCGHTQLLSTQNAAGYWDWGPDSCILNNLNVKRLVWLEALLLASANLGQSIQNNSASRQPPPQLACVPIHRRTRSGRGIHPFTSPPYTHTHRAPLPSAMSRTAGTKETL